MSAWIAPGVCVLKATYSEAPVGAAPTATPVLAMTPPGRLMSRTSEPSGTGALKVPPRKLTSAPFDPHSPTASGGKHGAWWIGDYQGIAATGSTFYLVWNDTRSGKLDLYAAGVPA